MARSVQPRSITLVNTSPSLARALAKKGDKATTTKNNTGQSIPFIFGEDGFKPQPESMQAWQTYLQQRYPDFRPVSSSEAGQQLLASLSTA